jgi:TatD DNase family protein
MGLADSLKRCYGAAPARPLGLTAPDLRAAMIDSHCHLDSDAFALDREAVLWRAAARGVEAVVVPAVGPRSWEPIIALAKQPGPPRCHAALGLHPVALVELDSDKEAGVLVKLAEALRTGGSVAVGECGLDVTIDLDKAPLARQERVLRRQLAVARELDLPAILHARGPVAYRRLAQVLAEEPLGPAGAVIHSYGGGRELLGAFEQKRLYFSFAGPATYPDARKVQASIRAVRADRLLAETDAPDQTPVPYRPGRSEPAYVVEVVAGMAAARGERPAAVATRTAENARRLFRIA